jgi:hypothetical protein
MGEDPDGGMLEAGETDRCAGLIESRECVDHDIDRKLILERGK